MSLDPAALGELAASIKAVGVVQPIVVRPVSGGRYQVIAGERRWVASRSSACATIPAIVRQVSNEQAMEMTIIENLQREDLNAMEQARAFERLGREFGLTQEQMAQRTGKERSSVANFMRLLKLPAGGADHGREKPAQLRTRQGADAAGLSGSDGAAGAARCRIRLSVRQTEEAVANLLQPQARRKRSRRALSIPT